MNANAVKPVIVQVVLAPWAPIPRKELIGQLLGPEEIAKLLEGVE
jgi:hypothetical protein